MSFIVEEKENTHLTIGQMATIKRRLLIATILTPLSWMLGFGLGLGLPVAACYALGISKDSPLLILFCIISFVFLIGVPYYFGIIINKIKISCSNIYKKTLVLPKLKQSLGVIDYSWNTLGLEHFNHLLWTCSTTARSGDIDDIFNACYRGLPLLFTDNEVYVNKTIFRISTLIISLPCQLDDCCIYTLNKSDAFNRLSSPMNDSFDILNNIHFKKQYYISKIDNNYSIIPENQAPENQSYAASRCRSLSSFFTLEASQQLITKDERRVFGMIFWLLQSYSKSIIPNLPSEPSPILANEAPDSIFPPSEIKNPLMPDHKQPSSLPAFSAKSFFTQSLAKALLDTNYQNFEIRLHDNFLYISLESPSCGIKNIFDLRFTDLFRTQDAISQRIDREINVLTKFLDAIIDIIKFAQTKELNNCYSETLPLSSPMQTCHDTSLF